MTSRLYFQVAAPVVCESESEYFYRLRAENPDLPVMELRDVAKRKYEAMLFADRQGVAQTLLNRLAARPRPQDLHEAVVMLLKETYHLK
jgi:hypothetical protein